MAEAFLQIFLTNLNSLILNNFESLLGFDKELKTLSSTLSTIRAVLQDAEEKKRTNNAIQDWLRKLKDAAYDADDILDEFQLQRPHSTFSMKNLNPTHLLFRHKMAKKLKDLNERIDGIAQERVNFHFHEAAGGAPLQMVRKQQTGSILTQPEVYGREEDAEKVVDCLVNLASDRHHLSVYSIVGMGGIGKTTLAQLVFNDERMCGHFELRIWVCVSDEFDVKALIRAIIESASGCRCEALDMDPLQRRLQDTLKGKRYLLVLDDVWSEDQEKWDMLKSVLSCGSKGASVVVTTRLEKVASVVTTIPVHRLSYLSQDDCWSLFRKRAFGNEREEREELVAIGREIVKKCAGVPLAAKALGGLMRFKHEEREWIHVKESELWSLQEENSILPALKLSYSNLPLESKQCFAFCAIFPKDTIIDKEELILLWMANNFISRKGRLELEDIGESIWNELHWMSFFQDIERDECGNISKFKIHDLVHDLAQSVAEGEYYVQKETQPITSSRAARHLNIYSRNVDVDPQLVKQLHCVRTILSVPKNLLVISSRFVAARALVLRYEVRFVAARGYEVTTLSSSIGSLKHLRYLDLSSNNFRVLPSSICSLLNLQTLKLSNCTLLRTLPKDMVRLKNLRHLYLDGCYKLQHIPPNIRRITCLQTLSLFIVDTKTGCGLSELKTLNLIGALEVKKLERAKGTENAKEAKLSSKQNLRRLTLSWTDSAASENAEEVLEGLEPHPNLQELFIFEYKGVNFPPWMENTSVLKNIVHLKLGRCTNCSQLPPLWKLPCLKELWVTGAELLEYIDDGSDGIRFACLESLYIYKLQNLKRLSSFGGTKMFPHVKKLNIGYCPNFVLPNLLAVKDLSLMESNKALLSSVSSLKGLTSLVIFGNNDVDSFPGTMLQNLNVLQSLSVHDFSKLQTWSNDPMSLNTLKSLEIRGCPKLESFTKEGLQGMDSLQSFYIWSCEKLEILSEGLRHVTTLEDLSIQECPNLEMVPDGSESLQYLTIRECSKLTSLPSSIQRLSNLRNLSISTCPNLEMVPDGSESLQSLSIRGCSKLTSLPSNIQRLSNLQKLSIVGCPELQRVYEKERGEEWPKIAHVPNLYIESCSRTKTTSNVGRIRKYLATRFKSRTRVT